MDKITMDVSIIFKSTILSVIILITVSCSSIQMVAIKNSTDETIMFRGKFVYEPNAPYNMDFTLNPGENNLWQYEIGYFEENILDKGLKNITLTNDSGCTLVLERDAIENIAKKEGPWIINIDRAIMNCN